jgi:hypothetical protein
MSEGLTLDDLAVPLRALRVLATDFGYLPAPDVDLSPIYPNRLRLSFHRDLGAFEAWREALVIAPDAVRHSTQGGGHTRVLRADAQCACAELELVAYADIPAAAPVGAPA